MIPYLSQNNIFVPGRGTQIGIQFIADPVSNSTLPQSGDRLTVQGSIGLDINPISAESKKNDENDEVEQLKTKVAMLELALEGKLINLPASTLLGRTASSPGIVEQIPMTTFATPLQVNAAISALIGGATQETLDTIKELGAALGNDANFAATVTAALAGKAPLSSPVFNGFITLGDNVALTG